MRSLLLVLLYVVGLLVAVLANDNAVTISTKMTTDYSSMALSHHEAAARRLLRLEETTDSEERANLPSSSLYIRFTEWINSLNTKVIGMSKKVINSIQARYWLWTKQSADVIFKRLKLDTGLDNILANPNFHVWTGYVNLFNRKNPNDKVSMVEVITKVYGDRALAKELVISMQPSKHLPVAADLAMEQHELWKKAGKSANDIFFLLKLGEEEGNVLMRPEMQTLYLYVFTLTMEDMRAMDQLASVLMANYGVDDLFKMFETATLQHKPKWFTNVPKLEAGVKMRQDFNSFFKATEVNDIFTGSKLTEYMTAIEKHNAKILDDGISFVVPFFGSYNEKELLTAVMTARATSDTNKIAQKFLDGLFGQWIRENRYRVYVKDTESNEVSDLYDMFYSANIKAMSF